MPVVRRQQSLARTYLVLLTLVSPHLSTITGCFALGSAYLQPIAVVSEDESAVNDQSLTFLDQTAIVTQNLRLEDINSELDGIKDSDINYYNALINDNNGNSRKNKLLEYQLFLNNSLKKLQELDLTAVDGNWELFLMKDSLIAIIQSRINLIATMIDNQISLTFDESLAANVDQELAAIKLKSKDYAAAREQLLARWGTETNTSGKPTAIDKARFSQF